MWAKTIIVNLVNPAYKYMQDAVRRSLETNAPTERLEFICEDITTLKSMTDRARLIYCLLSIGYDRVAWLDADVIVRKPLDGFWDMGGDIKIVHRPLSGETGKFQTGVMVVANTPASIELMNAWDKKMKKMLAGASEHFTDQICLWKAYKKNKVRIEQLPAKFNDHRFDDESPIWHAKGHCKLKSEKWKKEWEKYAQSGKHNNHQL